LAVLTHRPDRAQRLPEAVEALAVFQPNASGHGEFRSWKSFGERQLLKGRGQYLGERVLVAAGIDEVVVWPVVCGRIFGHCLGRWWRDSLLALPSDPVGRRDALWPACVLVDLDRAMFVADLQAVRDDVESRALIDALAST